MSEFVQNLDHYHESPRLFPNKGYGAACRRATGSFVAYFNDDCEILPGWDRTAIDFMDANPQVGIGAIYFRDNNGPWNFQTFWQMCFGNFGVVRREAGEQVGWFDEREAFIPEYQRAECLRFYGNDVGLALKLIDAGWGSVPIPGCKVQHYREQDEERRENNAQFVNCEGGNIAGKVLWHIWNGDTKRQSREGPEYGKKQLQAKYEKFRHLIPASETWSG